MLLVATHHQNSTPSDCHRVIQRHPPAVNHHDLNRDMAGGIAGQKGHGVGDLQAPGQAHRDGR